MDLAASLGVTTQALSQVIRIATQGEIDQNSAKFSLSDRQVPIRVKLPVLSRRDLSTYENLPVPTASGGSVPLARGDDLVRLGPTTIQRYNQNRRVFVGADLPPGVVKGTADKAIKNLPIMRNLPQGVSNAPAGEDRWQQEMLNNFCAGARACCWCSRCWCCSTTASSRRWSTWARCSWRRWAGCCWCWGNRNRCRCSSASSCCSASSPRTRSC
jgi:multidrug efflux pump subunit AcrB